VSRADDAVEGPQPVESGGAAGDEVLGGAAVIAALIGAALLVGGWGRWSMRATYGATRSARLEWQERQNAIDAAVREADIMEVLNSDVGPSA